jgi:hypothetical protein
VGSVIPLFARSASEKASCVVVVDPPGFIESVGEIGSMVEAQMLPTHGVLPAASYKDSAHLDRSIHVFLGRRQGLTSSACAKSKYNVFYKAKQTTKCIAPHLANWQRHYDVLSILLRQSHLVQGQPGDGGGGMMPGFKFALAVCYPMYLVSLSSSQLFHAVYI